MRGTTVFAGVILGLPVAAFAATWLASDGAPLRSPAAGTAETAPAARQAAPRMMDNQQARVPSDGGLAVTAPARSEPVTLRRVERAAPFDAPSDDWARLEARAAAGDRDALVFLTLMRMAEPLERAAGHPSGPRR